MRRSSVLKHIILLFVAVVLVSSFLIYVLTLDFNDVETIENIEEKQNFIIDDDIEIRRKSLIGEERIQNATFFTLCRNSDLDGILESIKSLEARFNNRYHYPWVFANNEPFTKKFRESVSELVTGDTIFTTIPKEYWDIPEDIDRVHLQKKLNYMEQEGINYGGSISYRQMCRFNSGFFYKLEALRQYTWYWRVEPDVTYQCDIQEDYFRTMVNENKTYGFALAMVEDSRTIRKLWNASRKYFESLNEWKSFAQDGEEYLPNKDEGSLAFIEGDTSVNKPVRGNYNLCHYWSNFEIANLDFFRYGRYEEYFKALDKTGNFFYERWGDAPVHSIAVSYLLKADNIKYFDDTGYFHQTIGNCPRNKTTFKEKRCSCSRFNDFSWSVDSCVPRWFSGLGINPPQNIHY